MPVDNLESIKAAIRRAEQQSGLGTRLTDDELAQYVMGESQGTTQANDPKARHVAELLARNPKLRREMKQNLPAANALKKEKMRNLRTAAGRTGADKLKHDFLGSKKRQAKRELEQIAQAKRRSEGAAEIDKTRAQASISSGRGRHMLTSLVNTSALGDHDERHDSRYPFPKENKTRDLDVRTKDGRLKGAVYEPENPTGKVVLFFSGSGGPAGNYVRHVLDPYLQMGAKVVTMDYRGFGNSETLNANGQKTGTPLSEQSLYKDGKAMLDYVVKNMGVKPEDVILHGYSLGGAVASKVAADFAQEQQKQALEQGRSVQKLGGVVLHSPIGNLHQAATETSGSKIMGFGGWLFGGGYNTKSHMQRLHRLDPKMPVHYVSGARAANGNGDWLDVDHTGVNRDPNARFENSTTYRGTGGHEGKNVSAQDEDLQKMVRDGRNAVLGNRIGGPKENRQNHI